MRKFLDVLSSVRLFEGIGEAELGQLLNCLAAKPAHYEKNEFIFMAGDMPSSFGIVLSGQVQVFQEDFFGNRSILSSLSVGDLFAESFACAEIESLPVSVVAAAESELLFIDFRALSSPCGSACSFHRRLIQNLLGIIAMKNINLTQKIEFISKRTTREKLMAYLSFEAKKAGSSAFSIPFNRQELADFLSVDRSAMSAELSRMRNEGILKYRKNQFELL
ncbi:MAG: Crp/Fnr family transcriptional regulator [Oscillospiraceae bacterium]|jgi:CRP-like cAMP-binding protein